LPCSGFVADPFHARPATRLFGFLGPSPPHVAVYFPRVSDSAAPSLLVSGSSVLGPFGLRGRALLPCLAPRPLWFAWPPPSPFPSPDLRPLWFARRPSPPRVRARSPLGVRVADRLNHDRQRIHSLQAVKVSWLQQDSLLKKPHTGIHSLSDF